MRNYKMLSGNSAAATTAYAFTDSAFIYPITPSSDMAEQMSEFSFHNKKNLWGQPVSINQMQSEAGVAGAMHGALSAGSLATTFTSSQGLLLMLPNLYKIAAERLPGVFYVASRTVATHALSIFGDHSDIYAVRQCGAPILCASSVQEVIDLSPVAHVCALIGRLPFLFFFDGFRTSHELQKVEIWSEDDFVSMIPHEQILDYRNHALNPNHPYVMGSSQSPDIYFQQREACNLAYTSLPEIVSYQMDMINQKLGTSYAPFHYYGAPDAEHVIVAMGSVTETIRRAVDSLNKRDHRVGMIQVHLFRPFSTSKFLSALPDCVKRISVLDKAKEPGSSGEPLYLDVLAAIHNKRPDVTIYRGRYGLSSKDTTPEDIIAVFSNTDKEEFTLGIHDDVTHLSLPSSPIAADSSSAICAKFWGFGSDGCVSACKNAATVIGEGSSYYAQSYSEYDSRKSGGLTVSHLRYDHAPIREPYLIQQADYVTCSHFEYLHQYPLAEELKEGGTLLVSCSYSAQQLINKLPAHVLKILSNKKAHLYTIDAHKISKSSGLDGHTGMVIMAAFFSLAQILPIEQCHELLKKQVLKEYGAKGDDIIQHNFAAIKAAGDALHEITLPDNLPVTHGEIENASPAVKGSFLLQNYVNNIHKPMNARCGNQIPVSSFIPYANGSCPVGTASYDKRGNADFVPVWDPQRCIQCNQCSFVCPHSVIRPVAMTEQEVKAAPNPDQTASMTGINRLYFAVVISVLDCTGCAACVQACPCAKKALKLQRLDEVSHLQTQFDYAVSLPQKEEVYKVFRPDSVKGSQFKKPLMEYPGACAGCGQTPYVRLLTQLFGERMIIANATGCSSIWGNSSPSVPYTRAASGRGPAWSNSLFEDAAEYGYGMAIGHNDIRASLKEKLSAILSSSTQTELCVSAGDWIATYYDGEKNEVASARLIEVLAQSDEPACRYIYERREFLSKKSHWIFGGDGWAYDIGFGGLDQVLASREDLNILIFDNEVYANTGGQLSKSTPRGAITPFSLDGKPTAKKDLASYLIGLGHVYVAQIAMGADMNQCIKAMAEAERYAGPSVLLAYSPCTCHGIRHFRSHAQEEERRAVQSGHWALFRYDPSGAGYTCDFALPSLRYERFLDGELRFSHSESLREDAKVDAARRRKE